MASMEMMQKAWTSLTGPGGLAQSLPMAAPSMNTEDLERRISDLRSVENWLRMNLSMLGSTIQGRSAARHDCDLARVCGQCVGFRRWCTLAAGCGVRVETGGVRRRTCRRVRLALYGRRRRGFSSVVEYVAATIQ